MYQSVNSSRVSPVINIWNKGNKIKFAIAVLLWILFVIFCILYFIINQKAGLDDYNQCIKYNQTECMQHKCFYCYHTYYEDESIGERCVGAMLVGKGTLNNCQPYPNNEEFHCEGRYDKSPLLDDVCMDVNIMVADEIIAFIVFAFHFIWPCIFQNQLVLLTYLILLTLGAIISEVYQSFTVSIDYVNQNFNFPDSQIISVFFSQLVNAYIIFDFWKQMIIHTFYLYQLRKSEEYQEKLPKMGTVITYIVATILIAFVDQFFTSKKLNKLQDHHETQIYLVLGFLLEIPKIYFRFFQSTHHWQIALNTVWTMLLMMTVALSFGQDKYQYLVHAIFISLIFAEETYHQIHHYYSHFFSTSTSEHQPLIPEV